ncbi:hypothetical protein [Amycolatopsis sp. Hca4]|uniref:hypothetical protein n=1 Tax=Amycolatopsis sp. Hca4 TaxID=2742131 RepID=UPI001591AB9C|nr:hypothetical protein [Amycolatopsis sp. Hca4]QKV78405.1 hypothetical protein HUT10_34955 [Amycolatopsis sp. Hca4]
MRPTHLFAAAALSLSTSVAVPVAAAATTTCTAPAPGPWTADPGSAAAPSGPGRPAAPATAARVRAAIRNFVACVNAGDPARPDDLAANPAATLFTVHFITTFMHQDSYAAVPRVLGGLHIDRMRTTEIIAYPDGSFSTEGTYLAYGHKLAHERWNWWPDPDGHLKVNKLEPLAPPVPPDAVSLGVEVGDYYYRPDTPVVRAPGGKVVLRFRQSGAQRHEAILFRLSDGATAADLFDGKLTPGQVTTIGQDNGSDVMSLVALRPGVYTLISFEPGPDGRPLALHGLTAQFRVC